MASNIDVTQAAADEPENDVSDTESLIAEDQHDLEREEYSDANLPEEPWNNRSFGRRAKETLVMHMRWRGLSTHGKIPALLERLKKAKAEGVALLDKPTPTQAERQKQNRDVVLSQYQPTIGKSARSQRGPTPWPRGVAAGGKSMPDVEVHVVKWTEPQLPPLDGSTKVVTASGKRLPLRPLKHGTTVLEIGMGGMKTVRMCEVAEAHVCGVGIDVDAGPPEMDTGELAAMEATCATVDPAADGGGAVDPPPPRATLRPLVCVTSRRNLAMKLEADLKRRNIDVHNYLRAAEEGGSVTQWVRHPAVIISVEQIDKLDGWKDMYKGGMVVIDEFCTLANSLGGTTVHQPLTTLRVLHDLVEVSAYLMLMDADVSADGKGDAFMRAIAPMNDVLYIQGAGPAMIRNLFVAWNDKEDRSSYDDHFELSLHRSKAARAKGQPNRTAFGGTTPTQVVARAEIATKLGIAGGEEPYHGGMSEVTRLEHFKDPDRHMEPKDFIAATTVMGVGTDHSLKCSWAFFETARGDELHGVAGAQQLAQRMGREGRSESAPLDGIEIKGVHYPNAMFVLVDCQPPDVGAALGGCSENPRERVWRKFEGARRDMQRQLATCADADASVRRVWAERHGFGLERSGDVERITTLNAPVTVPTIAAGLEEIRAWNNLAKRDQYEAHAIKNLEMWSLPTRAFRVHPIPPLSPAMRRELAAFRAAAKATPSAPLTLTADQEWGILVEPLDKYSKVKRYLKQRWETDEDMPTHGSESYKALASEWKSDLAQMRKASTLEAFFDNCLGHIAEKGVAEAPGDSRVKCLREVWNVLRDVRELVDGTAYCDLDGDKDNRNIYNRALLLYVPAEDVGDADLLGQQSGALSDPTVAASLRAAHKRSPLMTFAAAVGLDMRQLLTPGTFTEQTTKWVAAHNRQQQGQGTVADNAMANYARSRAKDLGVKGIVPSGPKATSLYDTVRKVLEQQCAMQTVENAQGKRIPKMRKPGTRAQRFTILESWEIEPLAPGWAEKMRVWHNELREYVPAGEYVARGEAGREEMAERERQQNELRRRQFENEQLDASMVNAPSLGCGLDDDESPPLPPLPAEPSDPNVKYESYSAAAVRSIDDDLLGDQPERDAAISTLEVLLKEFEALPENSVNSKEKERLSVLLKALRGMRVRHKILADLATPGLLKEVDGRLIKKVPYKHGKSLDGEKAGRRYATDEWMDYGDGELRTATLQGMPGDLRAALTGEWYFDFDGVASDPNLFVYMAHEAELNETATKHLRHYLANRDDWHKKIAKHYGVMATDVKRWPNIFSNGGGFKRCFENACLPTDTKPVKELLVLKKEIDELRHLLLNAPCNRAFVDRHRRRIQRQSPKLEGFNVNNKIFELLVHTQEDAVLEVCSDTLRRLNRDAVGADAYDQLPLWRRDSGALVYDGQMAELLGDLTPDEAVAACNEALKLKGFCYTILVKPNFGLQDQPISSVVRGREALKQAVDEFSEVRVAVQAARGEEQDGVVEEGGDGGEAVDEFSEVRVAVQAAGGEEQDGVVEEGGDGGDSDEEDSSEEEGSDDSGGDGSDSDQEDDADEVGDDSGGDGGIPTRPSKKQRL